MSAAAPNVDVIIQGCGAEIPDSDFVSFAVHRDMFSPDMCEVVLSNQNDKYSAKVKIAASIEIKVGNPAVSIFKGEVLGLEATYKGGQTTRLLVRGVNKMHRLLRIRKTFTFQKMTDQDIISKVAQDAGLTLEWKHATSIKYDHIFQHNLTGLEFIRMRAARLGCHLWCVDNKLFCKEPDLGKKGKVKLSVDEGGNLRSFTPRLSSASVFKKVTVHAWHPEKKELIVGEATAQDSPLGGTNAVTACADLGKEETFVDDQPLWSKQEADALAKARLRELNLGFMTGEAECAGNPEIELGESVQIDANGADAEDPFNGHYYVMGVHHRMTMPKNNEGGFVSVIKFARDAQKKK